MRSLETQDEGEECAVESLGFRVAPAGSSWLHGPLVWALNRGALVYTQNPRALTSEPFKEGKAPYGQFWSLFGVPAIRRGRLITRTQSDHRLEKGQIFRDHVTTLRITLEPFCYE